MTEAIRPVGLDVHKNSISEAIAKDGRGGEVRYVGTTAAAPTKLLERLSRQGHQSRICYEVGPCGCGTHRHLKAIGADCVVVAPSLIPRKPGDMVKTNRGGADMLDRAHRAEDLITVWVPDADHEAMRDLMRARETAVPNVRKALLRLSGFMLRHDRIYRRMT